MYYLTKRRDGILYTLILLVALYAESFNYSYADKTKTFTFGIVPQQTATKLARTWNPILKHIETSTGIQLVFKTSKNIPTFEKELAAGRYDFAYMNPYHYVLYSNKPGYRAFAKAKDKKIKGIFVVHKDSHYKNLDELTNQPLAFPSPRAFAASILTRGELQKRKINFKPVYVSSHDSVYRNVAAKTFVSGGGVVRTFNASSPEIRDQLRILYTTNGYTPHAFAANAHIPKTIVRKITSSLTQMDKDANGKKLLKILRLKGIESAHDSDWDDVRTLEIGH